MFGSLGLTAPLVGQGLCPKHQFAGMTCTFLQFDHSCPGKFCAHTGWHPCHVSDPLRFPEVGAPCKPPQSQQHTRVHAIYMGRYKAWAAAPSPRQTAPLQRPRAIGAAASAAAPWTDNRRPYPRSPAACLPGSTIYGPTLTCNLAVHTLCIQPSLHAQCVQPSIPLSAFCLANLRGGRLHKKVRCTSSRVYSSRQQALDVKQLLRLQAPVPAKADSQAASVPGPDLLQGQQ